MESKNNSDPTQLMLNLLWKLHQGNFDSERTVKIEHIFGRWGMTYAFQVGIYLWPIQLLVTTITFVVFRRRKLLGVTQKFIIFIMSVDLCFTLTSVIRDTVLKVFQMDYGFLEYRVCPEVMLSLRLQLVLHATSVWLNTLMSLHHFILVGYPLKVRTFNFSPLFFTFLFAHLLFCSTFFLFLMSNDHEPVPLIQDYTPGHPLKKIDGCIVTVKKIFGEYFKSDGAILTAYIVFFYTQIIPCCFHVISSVGLVIFLYKNVRVLSVLTDNAIVRRVKYLRLMAINIGLGLSFLLQELPVIVATVHLLAFSEGENTNGGNFATQQGLIISVVLISYSIGKPLNLLIYANLSSTFQQELKDLLKKICCRCRSKLIGTTSKKSNT